MRFQRHSSSAARGLRAEIDDTNSIHVTDDTPNAEARYHARFYFDPNGLTMADGDNFPLFYGYQGTAPTILQLILRRSGGQLSGARRHAR